MGGQVDFRMSNVEGKKNFEIGYSLFKMQHSYDVGARFIAPGMSYTIR
jgi:hypothetical protein